MKKIIPAILAVSLFMSCADAKRLNPTDPQASNYVGIHYVGDFGEFTALEDFVSDGSNLYCIDSKTDSLYNYKLDGNLNWQTTSTSPIFDHPTGICKTGNFLYVTQDEQGIAGINLVDISVVSNLSASIKLFSTQPSTGKIVTDGTYFYSASPSNNMIYVYSAADVNSTNGLPLVPVAPSPFGSSYLQGISDIEINGTDLVAVDNVLNRIIIFSHLPPATPQARIINVGSPIKGIAIKDNIIYVPDATGVHEYDYGTGNIIKTWGDYGQGNGRVSKPSLIEISGSNVFVGDITDIKIFQP